MALAISHTTKWTPRIRTAAFWLAYVALGAFLFWQHGMSADEGQTLTAGWNVSRGLVPYRDFFEFYAPGSFYILGTFFWLFGARYAVAFVVAFVALLSGGVGLFLISKRFLSGRTLCAVPFLWLICSSFYPLINHNTFSLIAAVWAWFLLQVAFERGTPRWYVVAGAAAGGVVWVLQSKGVPVVASAAVAALLLYRPRAKYYVWYLVGLLLALAPFLFWPLPTLWETLVVFPLGRYRVGNVGLGMWLLAMLAYLALGWLLKLSRAPRSALGLWCFGVLLVLSTYAHPDVYHIAGNIFPMAPISLWAVSHTPAQNSWQRRVLVVFPLVVLAVLTLIVAAFAAGTFPWRDGKRFASRWTLQNVEIESLKAVISARVPNNGYLYAGPFLSGLYFESLRPNATRFSYLLTSIHTPEMFAQARRELEQNPPALIVLNYHVVEKYGYSIDNPVDEYIWEHYHPVEESGDLQILVPNISE